MNGLRGFRGWDRLLVIGLLAGGAGNLHAEFMQEELQHRKGTICVQAEPGARVSVEQQQHAFLFGAALSSQALLGEKGEANQERYREIFLKHFNAATLENALKWRQMEPERGRVHYDKVDAMLAWADAHAIPVRGHCIYWGVKQFVQPWVLELKGDELPRALRRRGKGIAERYRGRFLEYDLNNEMLHGNVYADRLGPEITRRMAVWVHEGDPGARLFVNDYQVLTGQRTDDYVEQVRGLLNEGVPLAGIGVQGHSHVTSFDPAVLQRSLDRLAELELPVRVTEFTMPGQTAPFWKSGSRERLTPEEEEHKAEQLEAYFRICFAHPAVAGIFLWGFWEGTCWIPQSALWREDWTPTPAAATYRRLVFGEWWTRWEGRADAGGRCEVPAFLGKHCVTVGGREKTVVLEEAGTDVTAHFP